MSEARSIAEQVKREVLRGDYARALKILADNRHLFNTAPQLKQLEIILRLIAREQGYRARPPDPATMKRIDNILRRIA